MITPAQLRELRRLYDVAFAIGQPILDAGATGGIQPVQKIIADSNLKNNDEFVPGANQPVVMFYHQHVTSTRNTSGPSALEFSFENVYVRILWPIGEDVDRAEDAMYAMIDQTFRSSVSPLFDFEAAPSFREGRRDGSHWRIDAVVPVVACNTRNIA